MGFRGGIAMNRLVPRSSTIVEEELKDLREYIDAVPDALRGSGAFQAYPSRIKALKEELYYARMAEDSLKEDSLIDLRFNALDRKIESVPALFLGSFLQLWQQFFDALGQTVLGTPTKRGVVQQSVLKQTRLEVVALPAGSFCVRLRAQGMNGEESDSEPFLNVANQPNNPLADKAFRMVEQLFDAAKTEDALSELIHTLKSRVASNYNRILQLLEENRYEITTAYLDSPQRREFRKASLSVDCSRSARRIIEKISDVEVETLILVGRLTGANLRTGAFEIDLEEEGTISGKVDPDKPNLLKGMELGKTFRFTLLEKTETHVVTGESSVSYQIIAIEQERVI